MTLLHLRVERDSRQLQVGLGRSKQHKQRRGETHVVYVYFVISGDFILLFVMVSRTCPLIQYTDHVIVSPINSIT